MTSSAFQLTIGGGEVPYSVAARSRSAPLTEAQEDILRWIRLHGWISSTQAGVLVHAHGFPRDPWADGPDGTPGVERWRAERRRFAASDGLEALRRLSIRGYVVRVEPGVWWLREDAPDVEIERPRGSFWRADAIRSGAWRA